MVVPQTSQLPHLTDELQTWASPPLARTAEAAFCYPRIGHIRPMQTYLVKKVPVQYSEHCRVPPDSEYLRVECLSLGEFRTRLLTRCRDEVGK